MSHSKDQRTGSCTYSSQLPVSLCDKGTEHPQALATLLTPACASLCPGGGLKSSRLPLC